MVTIESYNNALHRTFRFAPEFTTYNPTRFSLTPFSDPLQHRYQLLHLRRGEEPVGTLRCEVLTQGGGSLGVKRATIMTMIVVVMVMHIVMYGRIMSAGIIIEYCIYIQYIHMNISGRTL